MTNHKTLIAFILALFMAFPATSATLTPPPQNTAPKPVITWASDPVRPNEVVVLSGGNFAADSLIELSRLPQSSHVTFQPNEDAIKATKNWTTIKPIQLSDNSAKFILPADDKMAIFACRLSGGEIKSNVVLVNAPDVWWTQGDCGNSTSPGGWLRVFGKSLNFGGESQACLVGKDGIPHILKASTADGYNLAFPIPQSISDGTYALYVHNGLGGDHAWTKAGDLRIKKPEAWPSEIFDVKKLGLDTALTKAKENHGGVIYFPRGQYEMKHQIVLPPRTILRGQGMNLATIYWPTMDKPPASLITGTSFAVEDIAVDVQGFHHNVIEDSRASEGVTIKKVLIRANAYFTLTDIGDRDKDWRGKKVLHSTRENGSALEIRGRNFQITGCDILATHKAIECTSARDGLIAGNKIRYGIQGLMLESTDRLIVEDNDCVGGHLAASGNCFSTYYTTAAQNLYFARNHLGQMYGYDREALTFDGAGGAYWGKLAEINGTHMLLAQDPKPRTYSGIQNWTGAAFCIIDGKGVGQYRRVTHNDGRAWEIDRPWDIAPDANSVVSVVPFRGRVLFIDNHLEDAGIVQAYGTSLDSIFARNDFTRSCGITLIGRNPHGWGWQPCWYCQVLDNHVLAGSRWGNENGDIVVTMLNRDEDDAQSGGSGKMLEFWGPLTRCAIVRRNVLDNNAKIEVDNTVGDSLIEDNVVRNSDDGIKVGKGPKNLLLRKNSFENVDHPRSGQGMADADVRTN